MLSIEKITDYYTHFPVFNNLARFKDYYTKFPVTYFDSERKPIEIPFFEQLITYIYADRSHYFETPKNLNIWEGFNIGRSELKHCSFLAWLFDPSGNHCQCENFLKLFLQEIGESQIIEFTKGGYYCVTTEDNSANDARIDISISNKDFIILIEVKIDADEQDDQIERYRNIINKKALSLRLHKNNCKIIFLTNDGSLPKTGIADYNISWKTVANACKKFSLECKNIFLSQIVSQYSKFIKHHMEG